jgi:two-component system, response regulator
MPKKILLIENHPSDASLIRYALSGLDLPCEIFIVDDGVKAIRFLHQNSKVDADYKSALPDLIIISLHDSRNEGTKIIKLIRGNQRTSFIPVVILTSSAEENEMRTVYSLGANSYIEKPVEFLDLQFLLMHIGLYWLQINRLPNRMDEYEKHQTNPFN